MGRAIGVILSNNSTRRCDVWEMGTLRDISRTCDNADVFRNEGQVQRAEISVSGRT